MLDELVISGCLSDEELVTLIGDENVEFIFGLNDEKIFDQNKFKRIPWTVIGVGFISVVAVSIVLVTAFDSDRGGVFSACALLLIVLISVEIVRREMKKSMQALLELQRIEAEKREMEMKLKESQISIMLSQIQPHFLYNTLNSIYQLCETNPMRAKAMVNSFALANIIGRKLAAKTLSNR